MNGLLLGRELVTLVRRADDAGTDAHGWADPPTEPVWTGSGNLQLAPGRSDPEAAGGGGHGPHDPAVAATGELYLPPDAAPADGMLAAVRGRTWVLSQVRLVPDPVTDAGLTCWTATVTETDAEGAASGRG